MINGILFDIQALVYGPTGADFLSEILRAEEIQADPIEVTDALNRLPAQLIAARNAIRTEEMENDYNRAVMPALLENLGLPRPSGALLLRLLEAMHEYHTYFSLYPETLPVLAELQKRGFVLGVLGNWEPSLHRLVREFEIDGYFQAVVSSLEMGAAKPDPFLFVRALKLLGLRAEETLHVGPSPAEDIAGALSAHIQPIWLNRINIPTDREVLTITDLRGLLLLAQKAGQ